MLEIRLDGHTNIPFLSVSFLIHFQWDTANLKIQSSSAQRRKREREGSNQAELSSSSTPPSSSPSPFFSYLGLPSPWNFVWRKCSTNEVWEPSLPLVFSPVFLMLNHIPELSASPSNYDSHNSSLYGMSWYQCWCLMPFSDIMSGFTTASQRELKVFCLISNTFPDNN